MRFRPAGPRDTAQTMDGDSGWLGVADKGEPDQLPPGLLRALTNGECRDGTVRTRRGSQTPVSLLVGPIVQGLKLPVTTYGVGIFSDPLEQEWMLLATAAGIWRVRDGATPHRIAVPEPITARVVIVQAFRTVLVFRGAGTVPWQWNGDPLQPFTPIDQSLGNDETSPIPAGPTRTGLVPVVMQNRLIIPHGRSQLAVSDIFDFTRYDATFADFNVTGGNDDRLTAIFRYNQAELLIFNDQSLQILRGIEPTLTNLSLEPINDQIGCIAGATVARLGGDVLWLSDAGVYQLTEVGSQQNRQTAPIPLSDPIARTMERINWRAAATSVAAVWEDSYFLAVPLDGASAPNALLVYSSQRQAWQGVHTFPEVTAIQALPLLDWNGRKRLHAVTAGYVHLLYEGVADYYWNTRRHITVTATTRAYSLQAPGRKRFRRGKLYVKTWAPNTTLITATDGVNETKVEIAAKTRSRTANTVVGRAPYDPSNAADDHGRPFREDYSVDIGTPFDPGAAGIDFDLEQYHTLPFTAPATRGRHLSLTLANTTGTLALTALTLEGDAEIDTQDRPTP